jgi:predicted dienelactone hydrolase
MRRLILATLLALAPAALSAQPAGLREGTLTAPHHGRPMGYALWYPAPDGAPTTPYGGNAVFRPVAVARDAPPKLGRHPVVLMSHGLGGHYRSLGWLAAGLAQAGAVVIAVNHPNSTVSDFDLQAGLAHWTRAQDLKLALDHLLADPAFGPLIDPGNVAAVGFSYGGWTALSLGGVRGDLAGYRDHCATAPGRHCRDIARGGADLAALSTSDWDASHGDPRIRHVVAIDPGLTYGLTAAGVAGLTASTLLMQLGAGDDRLDSTDISPAGSNLVGLLPEVEVLEIAPATHFSVLPLCTNKGAAILQGENDDPVCTDPEGADRAAIHAQALAAVAAHLGLR